MSTLEQDFHLAGGGPLADALSRVRIGRPLLPAPRRAVVVALLVWVPALILASAQGVALPGLVRIPFLLDPEAYARYLISLPLFVLAEVGIDQACRGAVEHFVRSGLVPQGEVPKLRSLLALAERRRSSVPAAAVIAVLAVAPLFYQAQLGLETELHGTWYLIQGGTRLSLAGAWTYFVGQGILRYVILGWIWRLAIWAMLLSRTTMLDLTPMPSHPDRAAGFGFLGLTQARFAVLAFAASTGVSGAIARDLIFEGAKLSPRFVPLAIYVAALTALLLLPLVAPAPRLFRIRRQGIFDYGVLAAEYSQRFDRKWVRSGSEPGADLLGTEDIQSLADLGQTVERIQAIRMVPIDRAGLISIALAAAAPMVPLMLIDPEARVLVTEMLRKLL